MIEVFGFYDYMSDKWIINTSDILTSLIQDAGRICEHYASDLFIDWSYVEDIINGGLGDLEEVFKFGFRTMGVDHSLWIEMSDPSRYIKIRELTIKIDGSHMLITLI